MLSKKTKQTDRQPYTSMIFDVALAQMLSHEATKQCADPWWRLPQGRAVVLTGGLLVVGFVDSCLGSRLSYWAYGAAAFAGLAPVACRALGAAPAGVLLSVEMLITITTVGAVLIGASAQAAMVVFLFAVSELLEIVAPERQHGRALIGITKDRAGGSE
jgi:Zn2+/Cd2+-exporting ATPase